MIQWLRSTIPSNSLAAVYGLARNCQQRHTLGPDVAIEIHPFDETNRRIRPEKLARMIEDLEMFHTPSAPAFLAQEHRRAHAHEHKPEHGAAA